MAPWRKRVARDARSSTWSVAQGQRDGQPFVVRFDAAMGGDSDLRHANPIRIGVAVPFTERLGPLDKKQLHAIEDTVEAVAAQRAVLVAVLTSPQMREFVLHTASGDWIEDFHRELRASLPTCGVQMVAGLDSNWDTYFEFATRT